MQVDQGDQAELKWIESLHEEQVERLGSIFENALQVEVESYWQRNFSRNGVKIEMNSASRSWTTRGRSECT